MIDQNDIIGRAYKDSYGAPCIVRGLVEDGVVLESGNVFLVVPELTFCEEYEEV